MNVSGPVEIRGDVFVDSGNAGMADSAGRVQFFNAVQSDDASGDILRIDARGAMLDGAVRIQGPAGASSALPAAMDLNGLDVQAGQIEVDTIGVLDGDVRLSADVIRLFGREIRTSSSGDINIDGDLLLPTGRYEYFGCGRGSVHLIGEGANGNTRLASHGGYRCVVPGNDSRCSQPWISSPVSWRAFSERFFSAEILLSMPTRFESREMSTPRSAFPTAMFALTASPLYRSKTTRCCLSATRRFRWMPAAV